MKESIKILESEIKSIKKELKKILDIQESQKAKEVIKKEINKIDKIKHAIKILKAVDDFHKSFDNIK